MYPETRADLGRSSRPLVTRRDLRLRSVGKAGPDPARVKRPGEGNVRALTNNWTFRLAFSIDGASEPHCPDVSEKGERSVCRGRAPSLFREQSL